jgi:hypothetical protein
VRLFKADKQLVVYVDFCGHLANLLVKKQLMAIQIISSDWMIVCRVAKKQHVVKM